MRRIGVRIDLRYRYRYMTTREDWKSDSRLLTIYCNHHHILAMEPGMSSSAPELQERLEVLLVEVNGLANRLKATDPHVAIPSASLAALHVIQRCGPQTVPQIARARFSSRQNIQILVNRLKEEGLVEFLSNPDHKRSALVRLTNRGETALAQATSGETKVTNDLLPAFSATELASAAEVLNKLRTLLDGREKPETSRTAPIYDSTRSEKLISLTRPSATPVTKAPEPATSKYAESDWSTEGDLPISLL